MDTKTFDVRELTVYKGSKDTPFIVGESIGSGLWTVRSARSRSSSKSDDINDPYAQKTIGVYEDDEALLDMDENYIEAAKAEFLKEVKILYHAQHQHVAKLIDAFAIEDPPQFALVMDRADDNLSKYLVKKRKDLKREWFGCLLSAVDYIHGMGIRHRDIKPANILVKNGKVYLADFGISAMGIGITLPTTVPAHARARTEEYCAPEVQGGSTRGRSADIFSLGAVFLKMFVSHSLKWMKELSTALKDTQSGMASFAKKIDMVHKFMDSLPTSITALDEKDAWQPKIVAICRKMLQADRDERPQSWQLLKDLPPCCNCTETNHMELRGRLLKACKDGSVEEVKNLIESGTDPNTVGAIQQASAHGHLYIVEELLKAGASINLIDFSNQTALHCAAGYGHTAIITYLCNSEIDIMYRDVEGRTALHCAAGAGHVSIVEILVDRGNKRKMLRSQDQAGQTALHFASKRGYEGVVEILLSSTELEDMKSHHAKDKEHRTPLHFAAGYGSPRVATMLLGSGADCNAKDKKESTPLHFATMGKQIGGRYEEVVKVLLNAGADPMIKATDCCMPVAYLQAGDPRYNLLHDAMEKAQMRRSSTVTRRQIAAPEVTHRDRQTADGTEETKAESRGNFSADFHPEFISLLTLSQYHKVDLWPISWDEELDELGYGAMGDVRESLPLVDVGSRYAFKRFARDRVTKEHNDLPESFTSSVFLDDESLFRALISELVILSQPDIKRHAHIVNLEGIAFDVDSRGQDYPQIWPVLVFQKAHHGNLKKYFARNRALDITQKLNFCGQVGGAIVIMHSNNIVHGDIKPENILVYDNGEEVCLKVTDFSYSCIGLAEDDIVKVPRSKPWSAPEYHTLGFKIQDAKLMEIYSFGMVCLWLLFPEAFNKLRLQELNDDVDNFTTTQNLIQEAVLQDTSLDPSRRDCLVRFFSGALCRNPRQRANNLQELIELLGQSLWEPKAEERPLDGARLLALAKYNASPDNKGNTKKLEILTGRILNSLHLTGEAYDVTRTLLGSVELTSPEKAAEDIDAILEQLRSYSVVSVKKDEKTKAFLKHNCYNIASAFQQLLRLEYRVRICILNYLERRAGGSCLQCASSAAREMAFCYAIGFGVQSDNNQAQTWLAKSETSNDQLQCRLEYLKVLPAAAFTTTQYGAFASRGFFRSDARTRYGSSNLHSTEEYLSQELHDFKKTLGENHWLNFGRFLELMDVLCIRGRVDEAMDYSRQLQNSMQQIYGPLHPESVRANMILANFYQIQNKMTEAQELMVNAKKFLLREFGPGHLMAIDVCKDLAGLYMIWGKIDEAEKEFAQLVPTVTNTLDAGHHITYQVIMRYAAVLEQQNKITEAHELRSRYDRQTNTGYHGILRALADELTRGSNTLLRGSLDEAKTIFSIVKRESEAYVDKCQGKRGIHFLVLSRLATKHLATVLRDQGCIVEAESMQRGLVKSMAPKTAPYDELTLNVMFDLAYTLEISEQLAEAEKLQTVVKEGRAELFGPADEKTTLASKRLLAIFRAQHKWDNAESECNAISIACEQRLGTFHQQTLEAVEDLASLCRGLPGRLKFATDMYEKATEISRKVNGPYHGKTLDLATEQAFALVLQGCLQKAEELLQQIKQDMITHLGPDHESTQSVLDFLDEIANEEYTSVGK